MCCLLFEEKFTFKTALAELTFLPSSMTSGSSSRPPSSVESLRRILEELVGQRAVLDVPLPDLAVHVLVSGSSGLGYSQLNELLLLLGFDRVSHSFFQFLV